MTSPDTILQVHNLAKRYGGTMVVNDLSFQVKRGEVVGLLGPNGAGKTTAFYMAMGLIRPDKGRVFFNGKEVTRAPIHLRAKMGMGYLAQEPSIFRNLTVEQNILCILETLPLNKKQRSEQLRALLQELHLDRLAKQRACTLSGGERRRLEITRALACRPSLLLLDEPFANIDPLAVHDVKQLIALLKAKGISILITDHNARELFQIVDRGYLLCEGRIMISGTVKQLLQNPEARSTYLGEHFSL